ncbi:MAG: NAD(P)/FAD-dependent oxidoreductase [Armatimonadota bacterium]
MYDIIVIGAGPAGNFISGELSAAGFKVVTLEEHDQIGTPVHCTGVIGEDLFQHFNIPSNSIIDEMPYFKVFSPRGDYFYLPNRLKAYVVDRAKFDSTLSDIAVRKGVKYELSAKAVKVENLDKKVIVHVQNKKDKQIKKIEGKFCIIATGAMSNLPYESGISRPRSFYKSVQTEVEIANLKGAEIYTGKIVAPGSFAYVVATSGRIAKAGVITRIKAKACFENLLKTKQLKDRVLGVLESVKYRRIPVGIPKETVVNRIAALGDAAAQLKTTSGGGVYYGLICADILFKNLKAAYNGKDFNLKKVKKYDKEWKDNLGSELQAGILLRSFFENVDDNYINKIFELVKTAPVKKIIENRAHYERHKDLVVALLKIPKARKLAFEIIKKNLPKKKFFSNIINYVTSLTELF